MEVIKVKFNHPDAIFKKAHDTDTGYDLKCVGYELKGDHGVLLNLGVAVQPPKGYYFELVPRSSISHTPFIQHNGIGIIDEGYRGIIMMPLLLLDQNHHRSNAVEYYFKTGKACAQMILKKREVALIEQVTELSETVRGSGAFGSSDVV